MAHRWKTWMQGAQNNLPWPGLAQVFPSDGPPRVAVVVVANRSPILAQGRPSLDLPNRAGGAQACGRPGMVQSRPIWGP
jgi:hypothetical protein